MIKERRYLSEPEGAEIRAAKDTRTVEGYAIVFNKESRDFGGWKEIIAPEAVEGIIENADVLALLDHNKSRGVLARSTNGTGSLKLTVDSVGVKYAFEAPRFATGEELLEGIERGDIRTSSFAFNVAEGGVQWDKQPDDSYIRTITAFKDLYDVSPVYREAYPDTTVAKRSLEDIKKESIPIEVRDKDEEKDKKVIPSTPSYQELSEHYKENEDKLNNLTKQKEV